MSKNVNIPLIVIEELLDTLQLQVWGMTDERTYAYSNAAHAAFLGRTREEVEGQDITNLLPAHVSGICIANNRTVYETKKAVTSEEWSPDSNGNVRLLRIVKTPRLNESGNVAYLSCVAEDITEQRLFAEQTLIKQRILSAIVHFSRELFSDNPDAVEHCLSTLGIAVRADRVYYLENHLDAATGKWFTSQKYEWCAEGIEAQIENQELQNIPLESFSDILGPLRNNRPFISHIKDIPDEKAREALTAQQIQSVLIMPVFIDNDFLGFVGFDSCKQERDWTQDEISLLALFIDVLSKSIQQSRLRQEVAQNKQNFDNLFNTIDDLLFILNDQGAILYVNDTVIRKTGYSAEELSGQSVLMLHPPERRAEAQDIITEMIEGTKDVCPVPIQRKDGVQFPVLTRVSKGVWNEKSALFGITQDMTALQFSEEKFSRAFHDSMLPKLIANIENGSHIDVNDALCEMLGYTKDELIGKTPYELALFASPQDADIVVSAFRNRRAIQNTELYVLDKSHQSHCVIMNANPILIGAMKCIVVSMLDITERKKLESELQHYNEHLEEMVQEKVEEVSNALWGTVSSLVRLAESRDDNTGAHLRRISDYCKVVATVLSFNSVYSEQINYEFIVNIQQASQLHDIGKVAIPDSILLKPGKLTREEFDEMKKHTLIGAQTLEQAYPRFHNNGVFKMAIDIALSHHERWDGKGYPTGLKGDDIPLAAQIVAICDVYDALRSVRTYKPAFSHEESLNEIRKECGTHFSQALSDAFFNCTEEIRRIYDSYSLQ